MAKPRKKTFNVPPQLGPCTGLTRIGQGAMGAVFRGHHAGMGVDVAVKVLHPRLGQQDPVAVKRFVREVRLLAKIRDPHVVQIFDAGQHGKYTFAIMELILGQSLESILGAEPEGRLQPGAAAYYLAKIARGLAAVHQCGIIHRDIKPENIMVDTQGNTKIADFGLARGEDSTTLTLADQVVGTPEYMAPELVAQENVTGLADLYSLGIAGYELLTGKTPFHKGSVLQIVQKHLNTEPIPVGVKNPNVPAELAAAVHRLLEKDPAARFPDATAAAEALEPFAAAEPPHRPQPAAERLGRPAGDPFIPPWSDLFLVRLLVHHNIYPIETLVDGLRHWLRQPDPKGSYVQFLSQRANLPAATGQRAVAAAAQALTGLRNRIGYATLEAAKRFDGDQLARVARELRPGMPLDAYLVQVGLFSQADAQGLQQHIDGTLQKGAEQSVQRACQQLGLPPSSLVQLKARLPRAQFKSVQRLALMTVIQQLPA